MSGDSYIQQILSADIEHNLEVLKLVKLTGRRHDFALGFICSTAAACIVGPSLPVTLAGTVPLALLFVAAFLTICRQCKAQRIVERRAFKRYRVVLEKALEVEGVRPQVGKLRLVQARTGAQ